MTRSQVARSPVTPGAADNLPLRSLTPVWVGLALLGFIVVALAARGLSTAPRRSDQAAAAPKGPTKEQVRQRQEHIALTERALELARKERKAAEQAATPAPASAESARPAPSSAAAAGVAPAEAKTESSPKPAPQSSPKPAAPATDKAPPAPAEAAPAKAAAPSGLEGLKADVSFE